MPDWIRRLPGFRALEAVAQRQAQDRAALERLEEAVRRVEAQAADLLEADRRQAEASGRLALGLDAVAGDVAALSRSLDAVAHEIQALQGRVGEMGPAVDAVRKGMARAEPALDRHAAALAALGGVRERLDALEDAVEADRNAQRLAEVRRSRATEPAQPLVSVVIATHDRTDLLLGRSLPSALAQTHRNLEVVVVGDGCGPEVGRRVAALGEPRVRFENLPRTEYPEDPVDRWRVAGVPPMNHGVRIARGTWIAPLDDDDAFAPDHVEALLREAQRTDAEMVYGIVEAEGRDGSWRPLGSAPLEPGRISRMSVLHRKDVGFIEASLGSWRRGEAADWHQWRRMRDAGVRIAFLPKVVGRHYAEGSQMRAAGAGPSAPSRRAPAAPRVPNPP